MGTLRSTEADFVAAPVRRALDAIVLRAVGAFALAVFAVVVAALPMADEGLHHLAYHLLPALLGGWIVVRFVVALRTPSAPARAWDRAAELEPSEVGFARRVAAVMPLGVLFAGITLLAPHATDPEHTAQVLVVFVPMFALLWFGATLAWSDFCREQLDRATRESDGRFRDYWASLAQR